MKGLPLAYHSDMQEDKEAFFDAADTLRGRSASSPPSSGPSGSAPTVSGCWPARASPRPPTSPATWSSVACPSAGRARGRRPGRAAWPSTAASRLEALPLEDLHALSPLFGPDFREAVSVEASLAARNVYGGTAPEAVAAALAEARGLLETP